MIPATEEMTNFTFKMDKKTRERYSALCDALGFSMSAATLALVRMLWDFPCPLQLLRW